MEQAIPDREDPHHEFTATIRIDGLRGVVIGLPILLSPARAGALGDRLQPRLCGVALLVSTSVLFEATALVVHPR